MSNQNRNLRIILREVGREADLLTAVVLLVGILVAPTRFGIGVCSVLFVVQMVFIRRNGNHG